MSYALYNNQMEHLAEDQSDQDLEAEPIGFEMSSPESVQACRAVRHGMIAMAVFAFVGIACLHFSSKASTSSLDDVQDVDQLVDPFNTLYFLQSNGNLESNYLRALCQWCLKGVHRPNVRSERRPTSQQLVTLHDFCLEHGIEGEPALQDALAFFVESGGGLWHQRYAQPLAYHKKRRYIRSDDPLEGVELPELPAPHSLARTPRAKQLEALPGLPMPEDTALDAAVDSEVAPRRRKESGPSPLLEDPEDTLVYRIRTRSRKGPRPRHQRDHLRKRDWEKQEVPGPLWYYGGWKMRPKYQPGQSLGPRYPYARVPVGPRGAAWILRR